MLTKLGLRREISNVKEKYKESGNRVLIVHMAIMKGAYRALGGTKYITIPPVYNRVVELSENVFRLRLSAGTTVNKNKYYQNIADMLANKGIDARVLELNMSNSSLADLLSVLIMSEYTEDILINTVTIRTITIKLLNVMDEREVDV